MSRRRNAAKGSAATAGSAAYSSAVDLAMDSVVKIFTVSTSPSYFLPWQNKSQRESMGSGNTLSLLKIITFVWFGFLFAALTLNGYAVRIRNIWKKDNNKRARGG